MTQGVLGHGCRDMFQRYGDGELALGFEAFAGQIEQGLGFGCYSVDWKALGLQCVVEIFMGLAVVSLLADKGADFLLQLRIFHVIAIVAHGVDKEALTVGKGARQSVKEGRYQRVAAKPVFFHILVDGKVHATYSDAVVHAGLLWPTGPVGIYQVLIYRW